MPSPTGSTRSSARSGRASPLAALPVALLLVAMAAMLAAGPPGGAGSAAPPAAGDGFQKGAASAGDLGPVAAEVGDGRLSGRVSARQVALDVPEAAGEVLRSYRDRGLLLVEAGWLDLGGDVWGCVVWSGKWSEVCLVSGDPSGSGSEVRVMRIEGSGWEDG